MKEIGRETFVIVGIRFLLDRSTRDTTLIGIVPLEIRIQNGIAPLEIRF